MRTILATLSLLLMAAACQPADEITATPDGDALAANFDQDRIRIVTADGDELEFDVYLALTAAEQRRGLMFVRDLPPMTGMLFVYNNEAPRSMWMKNTYIPLDMLFARADGTIATIVRETEPLSETPRRSGAPARFVLELNGGDARRYGIRRGSRIIWDAPD